MEPPIPTGGATFRVYTPSELQFVQLRPAYRPAPKRGFGEELKETIAHAKAMGLRKILAWTVVAILTTLALFAGLLALANVTDDTLEWKRDRIAAVDENETPRAAPTSTPTTAPQPDAVVSPEPTDFELPDDSVPPQRTAVKKKVAPKQGKRSIRTSPAKNGHPLF